MAQMHSTYSRPFKDTRKNLAVVRFRYFQCFIFHSTSVELALILKNYYSIFLSFIKNISVLHFLCYIELSAHYLGQFHLQKICILIKKAEIDRNIHTLSDPKHFCRRVI